MRFAFAARAVVGLPTRFRLLVLHSVQLWRLHIFYRDVNNFHFIWIVRQTTRLLSGCLKLLNLLDYEWVTLRVINHSLRGLLRLLVDSSLFLFLFSRPLRWGLNLVFGLIDQVWNDCLRCWQNHILNRYLNFNWLRYKNNLLLFEATEVKLVHDQRDFVISDIDFLALSND